MKSNISDDIQQRARQFLVNSQGNDGLWRDFFLEPGESDEWVSGYVGSVLCETGDPAARASAMKAWNVLGWRSMTMKKGWGYNGKAIADADSTVWCTILAMLLGKAEKIIGITGKEVIRNHVSFNGGISTYTACDIKGRGSHELFLPGHSGWLNTHNCVTAAAARLPWFREDTVAYLKRNQHPSGKWTGYWWLDDEYATGMAAEALAETDDQESRNCICRASQWFCSRLHPDGYITNRFFADGSPFAAALGLRILLLAENKRTMNPFIAKMVTWLTGRQKEDGSWTASAILRVPAPCVTNPEDFTNWEFGIKYPWGEIYIDQNRLFTTATVLKSLIMLNHLVPPED